MSYAQYFAIEKKFNNQCFDLDRAELISDFTDGKKTSLKQLTDWEYKEFIKSLQTAFNNPTSNWQNSPENQMRRKIIALFVHKMDYTMAGLDSWCIKYGMYNKRLNDHNLNELTSLVTQAERVYDSFIKSIDK